MTVLLIVLIVWGLASVPLTLVLGPILRRGGEVNHPVNREAVKR